MNREKRLNYTDLKEDEQYVLFICSTFWSSFLSSWILGLLSSLTVKIVWLSLPLWLPKTLVLMFDCTTPAQTVWWTANTSTHRKHQIKLFLVLLFTGGMKQVCFDVSLRDWSVGVWPNLFFTYHCFVYKNSTLGSTVFSVGADQTCVNMLFQ